MDPQARKFVGGSRETFAIDAELVRRHDGYLFGRMVFWLAGRPLGKREDSPNLAASARAGRMFLARAHQRVRPDLWGLAKEELLEHLYGRWVVFLDDDDSAEGTKNPSAERGEGWDRDTFVLDGLGDSMVLDTVALVAVSSAHGRTRIVARDLGTRECLEAELSEAEMHALLDDYCNWVERAMAED